MATENVETIGSGGGRADMATWESTHSVDITVAGTDTIEIGELLNEDHTEGMITIGGATVDATHYRHLRVATGAEHDGIENAGARVQTTGSSHAFEVTELHVIMEGFEIIKGGSQSNSDEGIRFSVAGKGYARKLLIHGLIAFEQDALYTATDGADIEVENCFLYGNARCGINTQALAANLTMNWAVRNCTFYNNGPSLTPLSGTQGGNVAGWSLSSGISIIYNVDGCLSFGSSAHSFNKASTSVGIRNNIEFHGDHNITDDDGGDTYGTGTGMFESGEGANNAINKTFTEGNPAAGEVGIVDLTASVYDLHLFDDADNIAVDFGVYLAAMSADVDIDGDARPGSGSWDAGADEIPVASEVRPSSTRLKFIGQRVPTTRFATNRGVT